MKDSRPGVSACFFLSVIFLTVVFTSRPVWAQQREGYGDMLTPQVRSDKLAAPEHLRKYVVDGKLTPQPADAVVLTLENNSVVRIQETQVEFSKFSLLGAHSPFDPSVTGSYNVNNSTFRPAANCWEPAPASTCQPDHTRLLSSTTRRPSKPAPTSRRD